MLTDICVIQSAFRSVASYAVAGCDRLDCAWTIISIHNYMCWPGTRSSHSSKGHEAVLIHSVVSPLRPLQHLSIVSGSGTYTCNVSKSKLAVARPFVRAVLMTQKDMHGDASPSLHDAGSTSELCCAGPGLDWHG